MFLTSEVEYYRSCEPQESWLSLERSMMQSSTLFECGPLPPTSTSHPPDIIHVISVPRPSPFFTLFRFRVLENRRTKNGGGLGTRLEQLQACRGKANKVFSGF